MRAIPRFTTFFRSFSSSDKKKEEDLEEFCSFKVSLWFLVKNMMNSVPKEVQRMAMRQALSMSPKQREDLAKLGEQLFSSRKRRFTDTPTEEDLRNDKNIEFVDEPKQTEEAIPVIELGSSYKKDQSAKKSKDEEASSDKSDRFDEDDFTILPEEENFFEKMWRTGADSSEGRWINIHGSTMDLPIFHVY